MKKYFLLCFCFLFALACGHGADNTDAGNDAAIDADDGGLTSDERIAYQGGGFGANALVALLAAGDSMFQFDPVIDTSQSDVQNAGLVQAHITSQLGAAQDAGADGGTACGSVSLSGTTVTVNFGPPPGCKLQNGVTITGTIAVGVSKAGSNITLSVTFTSTTVNSQPISGTVNFTTGDGASFTLDGNITSNATKYTMSSLMVSGSAGTITINGVFAVTGDATATYTFASLTWKLGDCYPNGGTLTVKTVITVTIAFDATTPTTGNVSVTVGSKMTTEKLPTYGVCG